MANMDYPIVVDPRFNVPPGVIDVVQGQIVDPEPDNFPDDTYVDNSNFQGGPYPPGSFTVVSQTLRVGADGKHVVDVVLDIPDQPGITGVDVRVTKI